MRIGERCIKRKEGERQREISVKKTLFCSISCVRDVPHNFLVGRVVRVIQ